METLGEVYDVYCHIVSTVVGLFMLGLLAIFGFVATFLTAFSPWILPALLLGWLVL